MTWEKGKRKKILETNHKDWKLKWNKAKNTERIKVERQSPPLSTHQWFIISTGFSFLLVWWSCTPPSFLFSPTHTLLLSVDRLKWHPQGQWSFILGPRLYRACSAPHPLASPPPPLLPPSLTAEKQLLPPALEVFNELCWSQKTKH